MKIITNLLLLVLILNGPAYAKEKQSSFEKAVREEISGDSGKGKGKGKPDNPGEHGRDNAAEKQRENPGKGSKGGDSWESAISDAFDEDGDKKDKKSHGKNMQ